MKRFMTLIAGIVAAVLDVIYLVVGLRGYYGMFSSIFNGDMIAIFVEIIALTMALSGIFRNAGLIRAFNCSHEKYSKKRRSIIKTIILNVILSILLIYSMTNTFTALKLIVAIGSLAASGLYIGDFYLEKKRATVVSSEAKPQQAQIN